MRPCRVVTTLLEEVATADADVDHVRTLDIDENPVTAAAYVIRSMSTLLAVADGQPVKEVVRTFLPNTRCTPSWRKLLRPP